MVPGRIWSTVAISRSGQTHEVAQHQRLAVLHRERIEHRAEERALLDPLRHVGWIRRSLAQGERGAPIHLAPEIVDGYVMDNPVEPGKKGAVGVEAGKRTEKLEENELHDVVCGFAVAHHEKGAAEDAQMTVLKERGERYPVTHNRTLDENTRHIITHECYHRITRAERMILP